MCIAFFKMCDEQDNSPFLFILAANRDEFFHRPTRSAQFWEENSNVLAGMDMEPGREGGTWLGITKSGKFAFLTNCREADQPPDLKGRGVLCREFLTDTKSGEGRSPKDYALKWVDTKHEFGGFNLIVGDVKTKEMAYLCNRIPEDVRDVDTNELHGVSNGILNEPWPKVEHGKKRLQEMLANAVAYETEKRVLADRLFAVMSDNTRFPDEVLPATGVPIEWERNLSSIFVEFPSSNYGTRSTVVYVVDKKGRALFVEKAMDPASKQWNTTSFEFDVPL